RVFHMQRESPFSLPTKDVVSCEVVLTLVARILQIGRQDYWMERAVSIIRLPFHCGATKRHLFTVVTPIEELKQYIHGVVIRFSPSPNTRQLAAGSFIVCRPVESPNRGVIHIEKISWQA
ncbi:MAG: hypothetical protein ABI604_03290, partial [Nitrospirota bacterium]